MGNNNCFRSRQVAVNHQNSDITTTKLPSQETERQNEGVMVRNISETKEDVSLESEGKSSTSTKIMPSSGRINLTPNLKIFTLAELKSATKNFNPDAMLGEGGFGRVFRGWVDGKTYAPSRAGVGMPVAVKKSNPDSFQGLEEWQAEVKFLGKFSHPNLVKLLGYCWQESQFLLVYEYMQKGSLENHLFRQGAEALSWETRLKIAIEAARGLEYLHTSEKSVIYRDFKASNILLDGAFNAKLSDFGLAKLGPIDGNSHITTRIMGTRGYAAPEYVATGHLYVKSDVYGFGVVLLEMLTGLPAVDPSRSSEKQNLVYWAIPSLSSKSKLKKIMDTRLEKKYPMNGAMKAGELILKCLESDPKDRPSMNHVLDDLVRISEIKEKSKERKSNVLNYNPK
ncbi:Kinase superfamily protein [Tripterygium wilfordii]|uniref:non-specific serine/threonine protein kinase n=1 Tax=Tripterygium wilfordii TaxID=458696 RepID=A0A7J7DMC7_TRIWF|nr:probable serine/threonine-protein kinase PIX13 [Tripterygium wilfordii]KAF5747236.1 Kinase superfamily protein [Tripterygium wilfordii]